MNPKNLWNPCCIMMKRALEDAETPVVFSAKLREYGIRVIDGGTSYIQIGYCPWSGHKLPKSLRAKWLAEIRSLGFEPGDKSIPQEFGDERWYSSAKGKRRRGASKVASGKGAQTRRRR
jgi:hypothetical protein